jgi:hypothetical protein
MKTRMLYRPVGLTEAELILKAAGKAFPPRLPEQPIFYPVLNFEYAAQIARDWNTKDPRSGFAGFVTEFAIDQDYRSQFEEHTVGASIHKELWIPAERLEEFNQHIVGRIQFIDAFYGSSYKGLKHWQKDWYAEEQFEALYAISMPAGMDFNGELVTNRHAILLNFKYWSTHDLSKYVLYKGEQERFLNLLAQAWKLKFPDVNLPG